MIGDRDPTYLRRRAREERVRAGAASDLSARLAHEQLATLYDREARDADLTCLPLGELSSESALFGFIER